MITQASPAASAGTAMSYFDYDHNRLYGLSLDFPRLLPGMRLIPTSVDNDEDLKELWMRFGHEYDESWNEWVVIEMDPTYDLWIARRTVRWWGKYVDSTPAFTKWVLKPMR